ncbi:PREDICTED: uncharacterized protein C1orf158-like, partial [Eufriesea mexicana]|uniref:uncharacterized protein C1orf158-like n=1 Tax=Eufriesea mexicana TaxID=516756 RepID=UPI00083C582A
MNAINAMNWNVKQQCLDSTLSLTDVRKKLFPAKSKLDRAPVLSENKYTSKTLVGNWFEHRASYTSQSDDWRTLYEIDFKLHINKTWKINKIAKWENKLIQEGLPQEKIFDHRKEYYNNMTTTYDLCYNVLPKSLKVPKIRSYNARQRKWIPEQDLTKSFGTLTQFGLQDALKEEIYKDSKEGIAKCRWWSTYREEIGQLKPLNMKPSAQFHRRKVNFNVPDLSHFEHKLSNIEHCLFPLKVKNSLLTMQNE